MHAWSRGTEGQRDRGTGFILPHCPTAPLSRLKRGFSLIEIVLYIGMVGIVLVVAAMFAADFFSSNAKTQALEEASRNARYAADRIAAEVRSASTINQGASVFGVNPGTLSVASANPLNDPTVFTVSGGTLMVSQGGAPAEPVTSGRVNVTDLTFEDLTVFGRSRLVRIRVTAASRNTGGLAEVNASATVETTARVNPKDGFSN